MYFFIFHYSSIKFLVRFLALLQHSLKKMETGLETVTAIISCSGVFHGFSYRLDANSYHFIIQKTVNGSDICTEVI